MKTGSKYGPLFEYLRNNLAEEVTLSFLQIEEILQRPLPASARSQSVWWSNRRSGLQAAAWMDAGFRVVAIDLNDEKITWRKTKVAYQVKRDGDVVLWDGELIHGLRQHMGMSQAEFAQELGVRQPTISEWENGVYLPKRSTSKYLTLIAERADFQYE